MLAGEQGEYRFQSNFPGLYENRSPHIHVRATTPGCQELVTQHYTEADQTEATFDLA
jgi:protocatechuate 3,4-dioxygenase beta subunit